MVGFTCPNIYLWAKSNSRNTTKVEIKRRRITRLCIKVAVFLARVAARLKGADTQTAKQRADQTKADILTGYFSNNYLPAVSRVAQQQAITESPETIWQFWDNPRGKTTPDIVKASLGSVHRFKGDFEHRVLNSKTMADYSDLPGYVLDKFNSGQIDHTHFSDLLRLNLLKNHGGIWLDATAYMTDAVPPHILDEDFFVFLTGKLTHYPYSFIQSCFIRAKKGAFLCDAWHAMGVDYWKTETKKLEYFQIHLMFKALVGKEPVAAKLFAAMPHITEDGCQQLVGDRLLGKFDADEWERIKKASFFQKTTYKVPDGVDTTGTYFSTLSNGKR